MTANIGHEAAGNMRFHFHFGGCGILFLIGFSIFFCILLMALSSH
jgi:hypothetical protein